MRERRGKAEMSVIIAAIGVGLREGKTVPQIAVEVGMTKQYVWELCSRNNLRAKIPDIVKTEGLNWKHPPHIPFLPCR